MNSKTWLVLYGLFAAALIGGAGYYCFGASGKYTEAIGTWESTKGNIRSLEKKVPYPSKANQDALQAKVDEYDDAVKALFDKLDKFQKKLNTTLKNTEFQQLVSSKVEDFRKFASSGGMEMDDADEFQLGFDTYANNIPAQELVPVLHYELEGIDLLLRELVDSGAEKMLSFRRDEIPGEPGNSSKDGDGVVKKYPVRLKFRASHDVFQTFINRIARNKEYFYIVRVLKVTNDVKEGVLKPGTDEVGKGRPPKFQHPETKEVADSERLEEWGFPEVKGAELEAQAREAGFVVATEDARVLMGLEKLTVFMVVDIARFVNPDEIGKNTAPGNNDASQKGGQIR